MCDEYRIPFEELFSQNHMIVVYQLNIVDQMFFRMIKTLLHRNLKRLVEPTRQVCKYVCKYVCMYVRMYVCMYVCKYICMYVCM